MRVMRGGKFLGPEWHGWYVRHERLISPEGHELRAHEFAWWSLLVRQAREFQHIMRQRRQDELAAQRDVACGDGSLAASTPAAEAADRAENAFLAALVADSARLAIASAPLMPRADGEQWQKPRTGTGGNPPLGDLSEDPSPGSGQGRKSLKAKGKSSDSLSFSILDPTVTPRKSRSAASAVRP
jgi:hypothetical protein